MYYVLVTAQVILGLSILNIWVLRFNKASAFRAGTATNMKEEFTTYGLPMWFMWVTGGLKTLLALSLLAGFWLPELVRPAAIGLAILMLGAVGMHIKVGDPWKKSVPAATVLLLSVLVALISSN